MLPSLVAALLASAPQVKSLAAPGFQAANLDQKIVDSFMTHFAQQLAERGFEVHTSAEIAALLGMERQKQLLACTDESCSAELVAALGVDALITGSMAKLGSGYLINLKIVRSADGAALAVYSGRPHDDDQALDFLEDSAKQFAVKYGAERAQASAPAAVERSGSAGLRVAAWSIAAAAVVALAVGGTLVGLAYGTEGQLRSGANGATRSQLEGLQGTGAFEQTLGWVALGAGAVAAAAAVVFFVLGRTPSSAVALVPLPSGAAVSLGGAF